MIQSIVVCGAGTMGIGIAQVAVLNGFKTILYDVNENSVAKAKLQLETQLQQAVAKAKLSNEAMLEALKNIQFTANVNDCVADMVIEAIVEKLEIKHQLFKQLSQINKPQTILASNTSSLSITEIAAAIEFPGRVVGMHFFNPAHIMKLVEVISGAATESAIAETVKQVAEKMGKTVVMAQDAPGFIVNRVARHFYVESLAILEEQVADINTIDALCVNAGFKMGPFTLMDLIGNDINYSVTESLFNAFKFNSKFRPSRIQQQKVLANHLGKKTGKGFYDYYL